jgi:general secretion pathway protein J
VTGPRRQPRDATAGFSLVEVLVALVLFALIGMAGFSMLDQVLRTQRLTEGRLERLAEMQRMMHLVTLDFTQARGQSLRLEAAETGETLSLRRNATEASGGSVALSYLLVDGVLTRTVATRAGVDPARQPLLHDVAAVAWQFYQTGTGWGNVWPPADSASPPGQPTPNPSAVELTVTLAAAEGAEGAQLRRVVILPAEVQ